MRSLSFFSFFLAGTVLLVPFLNAQEEYTEGPSVLPPGMEDEDTAAEPAQTDTSVPPERAKSAVAADESDSSDPLKLTQEQEDQLRQITQTLFKVPERTGTGALEIIEIPLPLSSAMALVSSGSERVPAVESYWHLRSLTAILNVETKIRASASETLQSLESSGVDTPEFQGLISAWHTFLSSSAARISEIRIEIRAAQIDLMERTRHSIEQGWPIPSSIPWYGDYLLKSEAAQAQNFVLASEAILIPEKIKTAYQLGFALGSVENLFKPEIAVFEKIDDGYLYLKILDNKRISAISYINILESLNGSIARYVDAYAPTIDSRTFVNCLIGSEEE